MADQPGSHRANIIVDLRVENFRDTVTAALNHQIQEVIADLEAGYHMRRLNNPEVHGVQVSVNINYNIQPLDTQTDLDDAIARLNHAAMAQDTAHIDSDDRGPVAETDQHDTEDHPDGEPPTTLRSPVATFLASLPVVDLGDLEGESQDCPVCREPFSASDSAEDDVPVLLNCNHIVGRTCIEKWMLADRNSCPMCRAAILEPAVFTALVIREGSAARVERWNILRGDTGEGGRLERVGARTAIGDSEFGILRRGLATVLELERLWDARQSEWAADEVEMRLEAAEREIDERIAEMRELEAGPPSEENSAAISALGRVVAAIRSRVMIMRRFVQGMED